MHSTRYGRQRMKCFNQGTPVIACTLLGTGSVESAALILFGHKEMQKYVAVLVGGRTAVDMGSTIVATCRASEVGQPCGEDADKAHKSHI